MFTMTKTIIQKKVTIAVDEPIDDLLEQWQKLFKEVKGKKPSKATLINYLLNQTEHLIDKEIETLNSLKK